MIRLREVVLAAILTVGCAALVAPVAQASEADGCYGSVTSQTQYGQQVGADRPPDGGATKENPFVIDPDGKVTWVGEAADVITGGTVTASVLGLTLVSGSAPNDEGLKLHEGSFTIADLPAPAVWLLRSSAVIPVTVTLSGEGGACVISGFVTGVPADGVSPLLFISAALILVGAVILVMSALATRRLPQTEYLPEGYDGEDFGTETSRHPIFAFIGGFVVGLGVGVLLVSFGVVPLQVGWVIGCAVLFAALATVGAYLIPPRAVRSD